MTGTLDIRAPADQTEGTRSQVLRWLKAVGDTVTENEPLIEIETDKVTVEVAAPASGVLREIVKPEQEEIAPGDVLGRLETRDAAANDGSATHSSLDHESAGGTSTSTSGLLLAPTNDVSSRAGAPAPDRAMASTPGTPHRLSPAVRRLLTERNLDASSIVGTGDGGRITIDDVLAHAAANGAATPRVAGTSATTNSATESAAKPRDTAKTSSSLAPASQPDAHTRIVPHTATRKRIAEHMVQSLLHTAPHVTTVFEADLSAISEHRAANRMQFQEQGAPLTYTAYFLAALVPAIHAVPEANSRWTDKALEIHDDIHIGVATAVEDKGLLVPVLRHVETLDLLGVAQGLNRLVTAARAGTLEPGDVRGGTFTISNHGVSGSLLATPIVINQPQSAILGIGKLEKRPVVVSRGETEDIEVRLKCYVTLTIDHRVMDGHQANRFLQTFVRTLEAWPAR
jgi:2-oxoglutarate dehydrogenase E2 component (dihydrolipoamide succinyltransferase)